MHPGSAKGPGNSLVWSPCPDVNMLCDSRRTLPDGHKLSQVELHLEHISLIVEIKDGSNLF